MWDGLLCQGPPVIPSTPVKAAAATGAPGWTQAQLGGWGDDGTGRQGARRPPAMGRGGQRGRRLGESF